MPDALPMPPPRQILLLTEESGVGGVQTIQRAPRPVSTVWMVLSTISKSMAKL